MAICAAKGGQPSPRGAQAGDPHRDTIMLGQTAELIDRIELATDLVRQIARDAEPILHDRLPWLLV